MREIKIQVLFEVHNQDFTKSIKRHYTTVDRLISGDDTADYINGPDIIAKRQFTGLKDKNGVEIYEGDVVRWESANINMLINWSGDDCAFVLSNINNQSGAMMNQDYMLNYEIIGNIHESPELLKK